MRTKIYFIGLIFISTLSCTQAKNQHENGKQCERLDYADSSDFLNYMLNNMDEQGHFISIIVTDGKREKCLIIENGIFYKFYTDNKYDKQKYAKEIKSKIKTEIPVFLSSERLNFLNSNLIDTLDYLSDSEYSEQLNIYFDKETQKTAIPKDILLRIAQKAFQKECFVYRDGELGPYHLKKWS